MSGGAEVMPVAVQTIREACRALVRAFGGQEAVGTRFGIDQRRISEMLNSDKLLPIPMVAVLESETRGLPGHPHVTDALARNVDRLTVERPQADPCADGLAASVMKITCELGDVVRCITDATKDGVMKLGEIAAAEREVEQLEQATATLRLKLDLLKLGARK